MYFQGERTRIKSNGKFLFSASVVGPESTAGIFGPERDQATALLSRADTSMVLNGSGNRIDPIEWTDRWGREWELKPTTGEWFLSSANHDFIRVGKIHGMRDILNSRLVGVSELYVGQSQFKRRSVSDGLKELFPSLTKECSPRPGASYLAPFEPNDTQNDKGGGVASVALALLQVARGMSSKEREAATITLAVEYTSSNSGKRETVLMDHRISELYAPGVTQ